MSDEGRKGAVAVDVRGSVGERKERGPVDAFRREAALWSNALDLS